MHNDLFDSRGGQNVWLRVSHDAHLPRFPSPHGKELSLKYADTNDWIELPDNDLESFIDMIEIAKDSARENCNMI